MSISPDCPLDLASLNDAVRRHVGTNAKEPIRMMAARGLAPIPARDLATAQFVLTFDEAPAVAQAALTSLAELRERLASALLSDVAVPAEVLAHLAQVHATNDAYIEPLLLNASTPIEVFAGVAAVCSEKIAEIIANNQARLLEDSEIVRGLLSNPRVPKSTRERVVDFLVRSGEILDGLKEFEDAVLRLGAEERLAAFQDYDLPPEFMDERLLNDEERAKIEGRQLIEGEENEDDPLANMTLDEKLRRLPLPALVAYATKGNKQVRKTLMRSTNRVVALAAVTSPMIQEPEVIEAANSKVVHGDVVSHIAKDKKNNWVKNYQVKLGLVNNPKTPLADAMKFVPVLQKRDLKTLSRSKNVPMAVRNQASKLVKPR